MRIFALLSCAAMLSACVGKPIEQMSYSERKALASVIAKRCAEQGYPDGHPEQEACIKQEVGKEFSTRHTAAERKARFVRMQAFCQSYGGSVVCF